MLHFKQCNGYLDTQESLGSIGHEMCFKLNESHRYDENTLCHLYDTHVFFSRTHGTFSRTDNLCQKEKYFKIYRKNIRIMPAML